MDSLRVSRALTDQERTELVQIATASLESDGNFEEYMLAQHQMALEENTSIDTDSLSRYEGETSNSGFDEYMNGTVGFHEQFDPALDWGILPDADGTEFEEAVKKLPGVQFDTANILLRIRNFIKAIRHYMNDWTKVVLKHKLRPTKLLLDVETRWSSLYLLIVIVLKYKNPIIELSATSIKQRGLDDSKCAIARACDFAVVEILHSFLKPLASLNMFVSRADLSASYWRTILLMLNQYFEIFKRGELFEKVQETLRIQCSHIGYRIFHQ